MDEGGFTSDATWAEILRKLDERTARGIPPTGVRAPDGNYYDANDAEKAWLISIGSSPYFGRPL